MTIDVQKRVQFAKTVTATSALTKNYFHEAIEEIAKGMRRDGETFEAAYVRAMKTPDGMILRGAMKRAPGPSYVPPVTLPTPTIVQKSPRAPRPQDTRYNLAAASSAARELEELARGMVEERTAVGKRLRLDEAMTLVGRTERGRVLKRQIREEATTIAKRVKL